MLYHVLRYRVRVPWRSFSLINGIDKRPVPAGESEEATEERLNQAFERLILGKEPRTEETDDDGLQGLCVHGASAMPLTSCRLAVMLQHNLVAVRDGLAWHDYGPCHFDCRVQMACIFILCRSKH